MSGDRSMCLHLDMCLFIVGVYGGVHVDGEWEYVLHLGMGSLGCGYVWEVGACGCWWVRAGVRVCIWVWGI